MTNYPNLFLVPKARICQCDSEIEAISVSEINIHIFYVTVSISVFSFLYFEHGQCTWNNLIDHLNHAHCHTSADIIAAQLSQSLLPNSQ